MEEMSISERMRDHASLHRDSKDLLYLGADEIERLTALTKITVSMGENATGTGRGVWVSQGGVTVWGHVFHIEGTITGADVRALILSLGGVES